MKMKKTYIAPSVGTYDVKSTTILEGSVEILPSGNPVSTSNDVLSKDAFMDFGDDNNNLLNLLNQ